MAVVKARRAVFEGMPGDGEGTTPMAWDLVGVTPLVPRAELAAAPSRGIPSALAAVTRHTADGEGRHGAPTGVLGGVMDLQALP